VSTRFLEVLESFLSHPDFEVQFSDGILSFEEHSPTSLVLHKTRKGATPEGTQHQTEIAVGPCSTKAHFIMNLDVLHCLLGILNIYQINDYDEIFFFLLVVLGFELRAS
jgi:hypothetical protein